MKINPVELLPLEKLRPTTGNPKRPMANRFRRGLRASLAKFGFSGLLVVAENDDGTYEVLDGNTRLDELEGEGVEAVPCVVHRGLSTDDRKAFILSHDRNKKAFDEGAVLAQLKDLAARTDAQALGRLTAQDNLQRLLAESSMQAAPGQAKAPGQARAVMASLVLYGPAGELKEIQALLAQVRGRLSLLEKAKKALEQALAFLDWEDARLLAALLAAVANFTKEIP